MESCIVHHETVPWCSDHRSPMVGLCIQREIYLDRQIVRRLVFQLRRTGMCVLSGWYQKQHQIRGDVWV